VGAGNINGFQRYHFIRRDHGIITGGMTWTSGWKAGGGKMILMNNFNEALQALYDHVGFKDDWVVYPVDDRTEMFWEIIPEKESIFTGDHVEHIKYATAIDQFNSDGGYYEDELYTQRFYDKWVYRGEELTMIFVDTKTDGMKYFAFFSNDKEIKQGE